MLIDKKRLLFEFSGDEDILIDVRRVFLAELPKMTHALELAIQSQNAPAIESAAHTLKGAVSHFRAQAVYDAAFVLEQQGRHAQIDDVEQSFEHLVNLLRDLTKELDALL